MQPTENTRGIGHGTCELPGKTAPALRPPRTGRRRRSSAPPPGPEVERAARDGDLSAFAFPRIKVKNRPYDFSFSGLKTAVLYATRGQNKRRDEPLLPSIRVPDVAASFQEAVCEVLVERSIRAATYGL